MQSTPPTGVRTDGELQWCHRERDSSGHRTNTKVKIVLESRQQATTDVANSRSLAEKLETTFYLYSLSRYTKQHRSFI